MTLFEYLAIAYSLIISFAVLRALQGLPHASVVQRRYWIHLSWVCLNLAASFTAFWEFWAYREIEWTYGLFLLVLSNPAFLYVMACILTPESPSLVKSWRDHFYSIRIRLFATAICWGVAVFAINLFVLDLPVLHPAYLIQGFLLVLWIVGVRSSRPSVHAALVWITLAILSGAYSLWERPGGLGEVP